MHRLRPRPDDPKADSPGLYILFGLASLVMMAVAAGFLILPPLFIYALMTRHHTIGAVALTAGWTLYIALIGWKLSRAKPPED